MSSPEVPEITVLRSTIAFLASRGVFPSQMSPPSGVGIDATDFKLEMEVLFEKFGVRPNFKGSGPDIIGQSNSEYWLVECKGAGRGKPSTQRNNFDRALASVVSYCEDTPPSPNDGAMVYLGLALPSTALYQRELTRRVRLPLRRKLNLWVLLYDPMTQSIRAMDPESEYKFA